MQGNNNGLALANYAKNRMLEKNKNALQVFVGETGVGKSLASGSYSGMVDESFFDDMERVVFSPKDFMHQIKTMKHGEALVYEEAGVTLAARDFQKKVVKMVGYVNQTFRHRNLCVTYNVPSMKFIEMQVRDLMHAIIHMRWIDYESEVSYGDCWKVDHNPLYGVTNLTKYEFSRRDGGRHIIDKVGFSKPPEKWIHEYEKMKTDFTTELYDRFEMECDENAPQKENVDVLRRQSKALLNAIPAMKECHTWNELEQWTGIPGRTMRLWVQNDNEMQKEALDVGV